MKKVLFLQIKGKSKAGVWFVNKTVGEELIKHGYDVTILSIRNNPGNIVLEHDHKLKLHTINEKDLWEITRKKEIRSLRTLKKYICEHKDLKKDYEKAKKYINGLDPDYIIASHYQCLDFIPKKYYKKTVHEQHSSLKDVRANRSNYNTLKKYNNKIFGYIWLSKATKNEADNLKFNGNYCLYNPVRFDTDKIADVVKNKKLVCITRIDNYQKRINVMVRIVDKVLKKNPDWTFELYGNGDFDGESLKILENNSRMKYMGSTDNPKKVLLSSSINLNTSVFEGFSLSILEASMCGVPTVSFNFGESVYEEIKNNAFGFVIENCDDEDGYIKKLDYLMNNLECLEKFSKESKKFAKKFIVKNIVQKWTDLFEEIDKKNV